MQTFLVFLNTEQKVETVEHGMVRGLAIANVAAAKTKALAKDYLAITEGDEIIGCNNDGIRWRAAIDEIIIATSDSEEIHKGEEIKIIKGKLVARGNRSIAAACKRMKEHKVDLPDIINTRGSGFKQGALAKILTDAQIDELCSGLS